MQSPGARLGAGAGVRVQLVHVDLHTDLHARAAALHMVVLNLEQSRASRWQVLHHGDGGDRRSRRLKFGELEP